MRLTQRSFPNALGSSVELLTEGGYGRRQIYELVQNGADAALDGESLKAMREFPWFTPGTVCTAANQGEPITRTRR